jgi:hypothetical protein
VRAMIAMKPKPHRKADGKSAKAKESEKKKKQELSRQGTAILAARKQNLEGIVVGHCERDDLRRGLDGTIQAWGDRGVWGFQSA